MAPAPTAWRLARRSSGLGAASGQGRPIHVPHLIWLPFRLHLVGSHWATGPVILNALRQGAGPHEVRIKGGWRISWGVIRHVEGHLARNGVRHCFDPLPAQPSLFASEATALLDQHVLLVLQRLLQLSQRLLPLKERDLASFLLLLPRHLPSLEPCPAHGQVLRLDCLFVAGLFRRLGWWQRQALDLKGPQQLGLDPEDLPIIQANFPAMAVGSIGFEHSLPTVGGPVLDQALQANRVAHVQYGLASREGCSLCCCHLSSTSLTD
mmetsp:Transcript_25351/g.40598  ORF Transcript_25351/g.40598 Transcript_25351/m.40598 type:complete len:265 (+) Transcript_25351:502-1296(+)